jgi:AGZA family xanthine/uracil permease-like MFS transporter
VIERLFQVRAAGSTVPREILGGVTTFLTMAYILAVNPVFLTAAGMPLEGAIVATGLAAAFATFVMAFAANYPIALAPGMGMNAFFAYGICKGAGVPWPTALGLVFWAGVAFVLLTVTGARGVLIRAIPENLKLAGAAGIGLFIAFIGLQHGGIVRGDPNTLVGLGDLHSSTAQIALFGVAVSLILLAARVRTAIFWGLATTFLAAWAAGAITPPARLWSVPSFELPGFAIDIAGALQLQYVPLILVLLFFALFDTLGTLVAVAHQAGMARDGAIAHLDRALAADAFGMVGGALAGSSPVTAYIESGTGVAVGARTGLANVVTGACLLLALLATPLVRLVGQEAAVDGNPITAPALILVGLLMVKVVRQIDWDDLTEAAPAFCTLLLMPLTFNISHGLAAGVIVYPVVKLAARRGREVHWLLYALALLFVLRYAFLPI